MGSWILDFLKSGGYPALAALAALESVFPPIPSELIFPFAGYLARRGELAVWWVALAGGAGATLGSIPLYLIGRKLGAEKVERFIERRGRWAAVSPHEMERANRWFEDHGKRAVLLAHFVPGLRSLVALPAGVNCMSPPVFIASTLVGAALWAAILAAAGYVVGGAFRDVEKWLDPIGWVVFGIVAALYLWRVVRPPRRRERVSRR